MKKRKTYYLWIRRQTDVKKAEVEKRNWIEQGYRVVVLCEGKNKHISEDMNIVIENHKILR
ncbi:hypothetical protein [Anaeromicropila populeti]|uniref:Uncharacterized protein n=1 Tax=Anaeromicropila populeti TaxID=37658 RepID=A0A1I6KSW6_9FIRM|nr:hypothetical protein [Anaeromicropila populeti]SFR94118.1 hypothetical protein SAMN05661086_02655 [Anaeromicropila populeti]